MIHLITGGARSGKSTFAEGQVKLWGDDICYIATSIAFDEGMKDRIAKHRNQRPSHWYTHEAYKDIGTFITAHHHYDAYILDCVTLMVTNLMLDYNVDFSKVTHNQINGIEQGIQREFSNMITAFKKSRAKVVLVTNEVGSGIIPDNRMARIFTDIAGRVNQYLGNQADKVTLVVCGQPLTIKE